MIKTNDDLWARIGGLIGRLRQRGHLELADQVEDALRSNTGLTDGWHLMLEGLVAARPSGQDVVAPEDRADLDQIIDAVRGALKR